MLDASPHWVRQQVKSGEIPSIRIGGKVMIPAEALKHRLNGGAA